MALEEFCRLVMGLLKKLTIVLCVESSRGAIGVLRGAGTGRFLDSTSSVV